MTDVGLANFAAIAKKQLGLASDALVPQFYLKELRGHIRLYPKEDNFRVSLQPNVGFGSVICLKDGCNKSIPLGRRKGTKDGGKRDGFGSLSAYRTHLSEHKVSLFPKEVVQPTSEAAVTSESSLLPGSSALTTSNSLAGGTPLFKPEKSGRISTRKRPSDTAFPSESHDSAPAQPQVSKKLKADVKSPLSPVTNRTIPTLASASEGMYALPHDAFSMLVNVRAAIAGQQTMIQTLRVKPFRSREDLRNIKSAERELQRLSGLENTYQTAARGMPSSSSSNPSFETALSPAFQSVAGGSNQGEHSISQQRAMDVDDPVMPSSNSNLPSASFPAGPSPVHSYVSAPIARNSSTGSKTNGKVNQGIKPTGTSSSKQPPAALQSVPTTRRMDKTYDNPQVSSSKWLTDLPKFDLSDDESSSEEPLVSSYKRPTDPLPRINLSEDESSSEEEKLPDTTNWLNAIGIKAPLPIQDDAIDHNGDYYGRGRDLFDGPRAAPDDLEKFLIQAGNADVFDGNERVEDALKYLGLKNLNSMIPGMEVPLMVHQAMGVKWMLEKERSVYKGGCLADEMGLGKTIQMIATILKNRPKGSTCKTTLIVAPLALLDQWKNEIETKTNCGLTCLIYHGTSKTTSKKKFLQHDIVLTTFSTLAREWPDFEAQMQKRKKAKKNGDNFIVSDDDEDMKDSSYRSRKRKEKAGLLFQVEFFRVVLDEAQYIRNRRTRISRALTDIQATYRWCLTGTPIVNTLADAYSYLRFLKIRPWYDWDQFNSRISRNEKKQPGLAITRLHAIMSTFLLRRQKNTKLDGEPIIKLPQKEIKLVKLEFSKEERDIYSMVEAQNQAIFNRYLRAGTVLKNYHHVLVLLLRLRQICSHASLVAEEGHAYVQPHEADEDFKIEFADELTRARRLVSEAFVTKLKEKFKREALVLIEAEKSSMNATIEEDDCPICFDAMTDAVITACGHIFCRECIVRLIDYIATNPVEAGDPAGGCPCCREPLDAKKLFSRSAFEPTDKELKRSSGGDSDIEMSSDDDYVPSRIKGKASGKAGNSKRLVSESENEADDSDDDLSDFIVESDEDEEEKDVRRALKKRVGKKRVHVILDSDDEIDTPAEKEVLFGVRPKEVSNEVFEQLRFLPSSKMKYMMNELQRLLKSRPDEKTIVVSQWTSCLSLVSSYLTEQGLPHVKYQGDMDRTKRDQAVKVFMSKEKARVMLMSLKCGGVGLNLTRANNVISLDLAWSFAVESQAFDRVHRVGQLRNVLVQRIVIADTVEDRMLEMQERKKTFAEGALGEGAAKKLGRLSVKELANLFGLDGRGRVLKR